MTSILQPTNISFSSNSSRACPSPLSNLSLQSQNKGRHFYSTSASPPTSTSTTNPSKPRSTYYHSPNTPSFSSQTLMPSALDYSQPQGSDFSYLNSTTSATSDLMPAWSSNLSGVDSVSTNLIPRSHGHKRDQSSSTIGSAPIPIYRQSQSTTQNKSNRGSASLPTPNQTPTKPSFLAQQMNLDSSIASSMAINQALLSHTPLDDNMSNFSRFSTMGEPVTPMTAVSHEFDTENQRYQQNGEINSDIDAWLADYLQNEDLVPKFTDAYGGDDMYNMSNLQNQQQSTFLLPGNQMTRTTSTSTNQSVPHSSPFMHSPAPFNSIRQSQNSPHVDGKTLSPQETMLEYKPRNNEVPLFNQAKSDYNTYNAITPSSTKPAYQPVPAMAFNSHTPWSTDIQQATLTSASLPSFNFVAPALPVSNPYSSRNGVRQDQPEFPAHLTSMESSASEAPMSSAESMNINSPKPNSNAETGTYSCTYSGCSQRFSTPRELQKHKRDTHRSATSITPGIGSGMSPAQLMERNSQSGPHRCERVNPTTGKSCNTTFSRPYDLTRHEDTIHNNRKVKLRCALCTEEKLFSRNDALTRHMRVVHPEVDFPGKHRRRGRD